MRFIGNKTMLLENIEEVINENVQQAESFCDIFSGSVSVGRHFKDKYKIISNDLLFFSYVLQMGTLKNNIKPDFKTLKELEEIEDPISYLNTLDINEMKSLDPNLLFFVNNYSPVGERMYVSESNALRIDFIRIKIEDWYKTDKINENEYYYLLTALIEGIPYISNIAGTYGAFNKFWDKRSLNDLKLIEMEVVNNGKDNECYNEDGNELIKRISGDILYIDPPYNARQYSPNYHILETAAKYDYPNVKGITGQRDYSHKKSNYCSKVHAKNELSELIDLANFKHIIMSYSSDGIIDIEDIKAIFNKNGKPGTFKIYEIPYRRFKSRKLKNKSELVEYLIYVEKDII